MYKGWGKGNTTDSEAKALRQQEQEAQSRGNFLIWVRRVHPRLSLGSVCTVAHSMHCTKGLAQHEWGPEFSSLCLPNWEPESHVCLGVMPFTNSHKDRVFWGGLIFLVEKKCPCFRFTVHMQSWWSGVAQKKRESLQYSSLSNWWIK